MHHEHPFSIKSHALKFLWKIPFSSFTSVLFLYDECMWTCMDIPHSTMYFSPHSYSLCSLSLSLSLSLILFDIYPHLFIVDLRLLTKINSSHSLKDMSLNQVLTNQVLTNGSCPRGKFMK